MQGVVSSRNFEKLQRPHGSANTILTHVAKLPFVMRQLLDHQLAAGNELIDLEIGRDQRAGNVALVMNHPFRFTPPTVPTGLSYREWKNRDLMLFEYQTSDGRWSLLTAKLPPMKFDPITGPPSPPTPEQLQARAVRIEEQHRLARAKALADYEAGHSTDATTTTTPLDSQTDDEAPNSEPSAAPSTPMPVASDPLQRFRNSMIMTFDTWHDGLGYDLDALKQMSPEQLKTIEFDLRHRRPLDWRDVEALSRINTPAARAAVVAALKDPDPSVRREAMQHAADELDPREREQLLLNALKSDSIFGGLSQALDEAAEFHPPAVVETLLRGTLDRPGEVAVHFAAMLYYIHGKADAPFDWDRRPFFLRFHTTDRRERQTAFRELCEAIGVDPSRYLE